MQRSDPPPFLRHHDAAKALLLTFQQALEPTLRAKGALTPEDFARAMALMTEHWPKALPLFARTCASCTAVRGGGTGPQLTLQSEPPGDGAGRRRDFVTRLVLSPVMVSLPEQIDPLTGLPFPRIIAPGMQANLLALFYDTEWRALNEDAVAIYTQLGTDSDRDVWERISRDGTLTVLADTMFVRVLLRFKQFHLQRQNFIKRMGEALRDRRFAFTDDHFDALFDTLFGRLRGACATEYDRARLDIHYGEGTADGVMRIFEQYDRRRLEQAQPVHSLGGAVKPAKRNMLAQRSMIGVSPRHRRLGST